MQIFNAAGGAVSSVIEVESGGANDQDYLQTAVATKDGGFIILYKDDGSDNLKAQHFSSTGTALGDVYEVTSGSAISEIDAATLADGRVAVTFTNEADEIGMEIIDIRDAATYATYGSALWQIGTAGADTMNGDGDIVRAHAGNDTIYDGGGLNLIYGDAGNDHITIYGVDPDESVHGGLGIDTLHGTADAGVIIDLLAGTVTLGADVEMTTGFENFVGTAVNETIRGTNGANVLSGLGAADTILGRNGVDRINGGAGIDQLTGGAGNDKFIFNVVATLANADVVHDFTHNKDTIQLENSIFTNLGAKALNLAEEKFHVGAGAHDADDRVIYNDNTGKLYYDGNGKAAGQKVLIATLDAGLALTASDFQVI